MISRSSLSFAAALVAAFALAGPAHADLPPPDGSKFVGFSFKVENLAPFKDFALLAYPCGGSNGAPSADMTELKEGVTVDVGRRGGNCTLYAMPRADFDQWRKANPGNTGPAVSALFESKQVRACSGAPQVVGVLPTSDARNAVSETLHVTKLDGTGCTIVSGSGDDKHGSSPPAAPALPASPASPASPTPPPVNGGGCAGCAIDGQPLGFGSFAASLSFVALALSRLAGARKRSGSATKTEGRS
jgi:hypothetical protein